MSLYLTSLNLDFILFLQSLGAWLHPVMRLLSFLGDEYFFLILLPLVYWCIDTGLGLRLTVLLLWSNALNAMLKLAFHTPRPFWLSQEVRAGVYEGTFGIPSGHAQNATALWGCAANSSRRRWARGAAAVLVFLISLSRWFLGVHFPFDALVGWIAGGLLLGLFLRLERPVRAWLAKQAFGHQVLAAFAASLTLILASYLVRSAFQAPLPEDWVANAQAAFPGEEPLEPWRLEAAFTSAGSFFGLVLGSLWLFSGSGFHPGGSLAQRSLRFLLGAAGMIALWYGLGAVFPRGDFPAAYLLRYLRYFLLGCWTAAGAPWLFIRLKLASASRSLP